MKKQKVLITGAKGFIGTHLVNHLEKSLEILAFDKKDGRDIFDIDNLLGVTDVIHLAALTNVEESQFHPSPYFWTNALGTAHLVELCAKYNVRMIYISSAAAAFPTTSPYAYTKWLGEQMVEGIMEGIAGVILRLENVYGRGMSEASLMSRYLHDKELTVYGDGNQTRDFIYIDDVINIITYALLNGWNNMRLDVGTGRVTSVNAVAKIFHDLTKKPIIKKEARKEIRESRANTKMLRKLYPFPMQTNIQKNIEELLGELN